MKIEEYMRDRKTLVAAKALGITRQSLWLICTGKMKPSKKRCLDIEAWSEGKVPCWELRPDLFSKPEVAD